PPSRAARARPRPCREWGTRAAPGGWSRSSGRRRRPRLDWPSLLSIMNDALRAEVAELADAHDSGSCARKGVGVRVPPSAPCFPQGTDLDGCGNQVPSVRRCASEGENAVAATMRLATNHGNASRAIQYTQQRHT